jgi:hypothetical protein
MSISYQKGVSKSRERERGEHHRHKASSLIMLSILVKLIQ